MRRKNVLLKMLEKLSEHKENLMYIAFIIAVLALFLGGCQYLNHKIGLQDDHLLEEMIEKKIENELGLDIDLTPESQE